jgi:hypothetical protein
VYGQFLLHQCEPELMIYRYLVFKVGLFVSLAWLADQLRLPVPTDIYTLFAFELIVLVVAIPIISLWRSFR